MKLALKTHRVVPVALVETALALLAALVGTTLVALPGPAGDAPLNLLVALAGSLVVAPPLVRAWPTNRTNTVRGAGAVAAVVVLCQIAPGVGVVAIIAATLGAPQMLAYVGMLTWLLALQVVAGVLVSAPYQGLAPAVYVMLCALVGRIDGVVQPWAWPLASIAPVTTVVIGTASLALSLTALACHGTRGSAAGASG